MTSRNDAPDGDSLGPGVSRLTAPGRLRAGESVVGCMATTRSTEAARAMALAGCDFLMFDAEHTAIGQDSIVDLVMATAGLDCLPMVRVPSSDASLAKPALDVGAMGIAFPHVSSVADATALVACTKYPPVGERGVGPAHAMRRWGLGLADYVTFAQQHTLAVAIVESVGTGDVLDEILSVPGLDVVLIAREDLAASMGRLGDPRHPDVVSTARRMEDRVRAAGIALGCRLSPGTDVAEAREQGFQFIITASDMQLLAEGVRLRS